jgi:glycosyltransferase involved in cell wall biosynthesis
MKLSIIIPTYYRKDGSTKTYLKRALESVFNQTHQDFKIYLIGDRYEKEKEYEIYELLENYDKNKIHFENLDIAQERDFYKDKFVLWSYGGVNATNYGIKLSLKDSNNYICHLDHDDYWDKEHLMLINECINETNSDWMCTKSFYRSFHNVLPNILSYDKFVNYLPKGESLIHSSVCMNFKKIPLEYRDIFKETGKLGLPSDADLWNRCNEYIIKNNLISTLINKITCFHIEEGYERK